MCIRDSCIALNSLFCADVPLRAYTLTYSWFHNYTYLDLAENNHDKSWVTNVCGNNIYGLIGLATTAFYAVVIHAVCYSERKVL